MIAVLFNSAGVRLGEIAVGDDCRILNFGGAFFARTETVSPLDGGRGEGLTYEQSLIDVRCELDVFDPRKSVDSDRVEQPRVLRVTKEGRLVDLVRVYDAALDCVRAWNVGPNPRGHPNFVGDFGRLTKLAQALNGDKA